MSVSDLQTVYAGRKPALFGLAFKTSLLTVLTLGFYRFWMKTRLRRFYWSAIRPGGQPLEYVGRASEKLLGFLTAVVFLAFYIGIVNLILMFLSFSLLGGNQPAYLLSFLGILPVVFFAQYRARRYILARTRWRGIRFGLEPGVSGFVWRSLLHWGLTAVTLGLYWPVKTFWLEKYRTDRTWYGDQKMVQTGRWHMLIKPMMHVYIAVLVAGAALGVGLFMDEPVTLFLWLICLPWLLYGLARYKAESFKRLTEAKELGDVRLKTAPRTRRIMGIYLGGYALVYLCIFAGIFLFMALGALIFGMIMAVFGGGFDVDALEQMATAGGVDFLGLPAAFWTVIGVVIYFAGFLFIQVLNETFVTLPMARHFAEVTEVVNAAGLNDVGQRARDEFAEAEGFADALPLGEGM